MCRGIVNVHDTAGLNAFGEISLPLQFRGNGFDGAVRIPITSPKIAQEEEGRRVFDDLRYKKWPAHREGEPRLGVGGLRNILPSNRERFGIQS